MDSRQLTLQLTWSCDIRCSHCCQDHTRVDLSYETAIKAIDGYRRAGVLDRVGFTGGEPFTRYDLMLRLAKHALTLGLPSGVVTNGRWALDQTIAFQRLSELQTAGIDTIVVSFDSFHEEFVPIGRVEGLLKVARSLGLATFVYASYSSGRQLSRTKIIVEQLSKIEGVDIQYRDVVPVGFGAMIPIGLASKSYREVDKRCPIQGNFTIWPDGRVFPCCSAGTHENLCIGDLKADAIEKTINRKISWGILKSIHTSGLDEVVLQLPEKQRREIARGRYVSSCHLCHVLFNDNLNFEILNRSEIKPIGIAKKILLNSSIHLPPASLIDNDH